MVKLVMPPNCRLVTEEYRSTVTLVGAEVFRKQVAARRRSFHEAGHCCCAIQFGIPIISVTNNSTTPHMLRGHYCAPSGDIGVGVMATLCLSGPASETFFCGRIDDGSDATDIAMAREYLSRRYDALRIGTELTRHRDAAERLVRDQAQRIQQIADALLRHGTLSGEQLSSIM